MPVQCPHLKVGIVHVRLHGVTQRLADAAVGPKQQRLVQSGELQIYTWGGRERKRA